MYHQTQDLVFHWSFFAACREGNMEIVNLLLLHNGIKVNKMLNFDDVPSERKMVKKVKVEKQEKTALLLAAESGHLDIIKRLEEHQADIALKTSEGNTALHLAAKNNQLNVVKYLIEVKSFNIDEKNKYEETALTIAARQAAFECIKYLISKGADICQKDIWNQSVIYNAVLSENLDCVKAIVDLFPESEEFDKKTIINTRELTCGNTALLLAAESGLLDILKLLKENQADITSKTSKGDTALHLAAQKNHLIVVKYLLQKKRNFNEPNEMGCTALFNAVDHGALECVKHLIEKGADVLKTNEKKESVLDRAVLSQNLECVEAIIKSFSKYSLEDQEKIKTHTKKAFLLAAECGKLDIIKVLRDHLVDIKFKTIEGNTALHCAAKGNHLRVVKYLTEEKEFNIHEENKVGDTALSLAVSEAAVDCIKYLLSKGANIWRIDNEGKSALHYAVSSGKCNRVKALLESISDNDDILFPKEIKENIVNQIQQENGESSFLLAAKSGNLEILELLEKHKADINLKTFQEETALHLAARNNHLDIVKYLIESKGFNINTVDMFGDTALSTAVYSEDCIKYLVGKGANVLHMNKRGETILYKAVCTGELVCVKNITESIPDGDLMLLINLLNPKTYFSVLHVAVDKDYEDIAEYLLNSKGADPLLKNEYWDKTPCDLAKSPNIRSMLEAAKSKKRKRSCED